MEKLSVAYQKAYGSLNAEQKKAVDQVEGPVLVVAGPGTGKTQLLSTRIGRILETTDSAPENILCLTFSESAATTMQERLMKLIGPAAYEVTVSTYHSFGNDLITKYADLFNIEPGTTPSDELAIDKVVRSVCEQLSYSNPFKDEIYIKNLKELISGFKRALITPELLLSLCDANDQFISQANALVNDHLTVGERITKKLLPNFAQLLEASDTLPDQPIKGLISLKQLWLESLASAVGISEETNSTPTLTKWKNAWLEVSKDSSFILGCQKPTKRMRAMAEILTKYDQELKRQGIYDYDDMIMLAIKGLDTNDDVKLTLQERFHYILLDEFQDTNEAQLRLVELLADNEINEGRPNILAVGDDDQAIYSFQGAHYSHMQRFYDSYRDVSLITLKTNYRSSPGIINLSGAIREQISDRLTLSDKQQESSDPQAIAEINYVETPLDAEHLAWTAEHIERLIKDGEDPSEIAVLAPKHQLLIDLMPYLHSRSIPVNYEQRDNILEDQIIQQVINIARLAVSLNDSYIANHLWPEVLSYDFWKLPVSLIWEVSWQARRDKQAWTDLLINNEATKPIALFIIKLSQIAEHAPFETLINYIIGNEPIELNEPGISTYVSPFYDYYFKHLDGQAMPADEWRLIGHLSQLRAKAHASSDKGLNLKQFIEFVDDYNNAELKIVDRTPFREAEKAITLMTAFASKGQEYNTIILIDFCDSLWGKKKRQPNNKITLPPNLAHVKNDNSSDDEKLRLLFVAISRAKNRLSLVSYQSSLSGKAEPRLHYLAITEEENGLSSPLLDSSGAKYLTPHVSTDEIEYIRPAWFDKHLLITPKLSAMLQDRLQNFYLNATGLNAYSDLSRGGPREFYKEQILLFPPSPSISSQFGSAIHATLDWQFKQTLLNKQPPSITQIIKQFEERLSSQRLTENQFTQLKERGAMALEQYFKQTPLKFNPEDLSEQKFSVMLGDARLNGAIDRLKINAQDKTIHIIDFKTGKSYDRFTPQIKSYHHQRQLYFYKLLVELTPKFKDYQVTKGTIQFIEPDSEGRVESVDLTFQPEEENKLRELIASVWQHVMSLDLPDTASYGDDLTSIKKFEQSLISSSYAQDGLPVGSDLIASAEQQ